MVEAFRSIWKHRWLIFQLTRREVVAQFRGSFLGMFWTLLEPFLMLLVYTFVFSVVFEMRWGKTLNSRFDFALLLFIGVIIHGFVSKSLNRSPNQMNANLNLIKRVIFPIEILPVVTIFVVLFQTAINFGVLFIFIVLVHHGLPWTMIFLPVILFPLIIFVAGCNWFLAASGVYLRDLNQTIGLFTLILLFLAPVFYPLEAVPENFRLIIYINPLTFIIEQVRAVLIWAKLPDFKGLMLYSVVGSIIAWFGLFFFQKTRKWFVDVL